MTHEATLREMAAIRQAVEHGRSGEPWVSQHAAYTRSILAGADALAALREARETPPCPLCGAVSRLAISRAMYRNAMVETAKTSIMCPACGRAVSLITRDRNGPRQDEAFEPAPYYLTTDGTHDIENAQIHGRQYPDVFVARCRVMNQRDPYPPFEGTDVMDGDENRS